jgi:hypothetical protein
MKLAGQQDPVLFVGGSGVVGSRATKTLRRLEPELKLLIGARNLLKAEALALDVGGATALRVDLERDDLGLPRDTPVSAVVTLLKDDTLNTLRFAQARGVPFIAFSNWLFDIAPEIARYVQQPTRAPLLLLGHVLGGTVVLTALHFAREFRSVGAIEIGVVMDSDDGGGPAAQGDFERIAQNVPNPLLLHGGRWIWARGERAQRRFVDAAGVERQGQAVPVLDIPSLAAATSASSVRVDLALRDAASRPPGDGPSHSVCIEIEGERHAGGAGRFRYALSSQGGHSVTSAQGVALATERLLGLAGRGPVPAGLYHPETLLDPVAVVERLRELGTRIERLETRHSLYRI